MPPKLQLFLRLITEKYYFNVEEDKTIVLHSRDLKKAGFSHSDIEQVLDFLKREKVILRARSSSARSESIIPVSPKEKVKLFGPSVREIFSGQSPDYWLAIELDSRERLLKFNEGLGLKKGLISLPRIDLAKGKQSELDSLHPEILKKCISLYEKEEYSEAVEKSFKVVRDRLRQLTKYETGSEAFGKTQLHIKGAIASHVDKDFNEGVKFLTMAIDKFRNEKSHTSDGKIDDPKRAYEYLRLSSLAMHLLDDAEVQKPSIAQ